MQSGVPRDFKGSFERIVAARARQIELRNVRSENLSRLREYLRVRLSEFLTNTDPVTGSRLIDIGFEENKAHGASTLVVVVFEGSRLKITVDGIGNFTYASLPDLFDTVARMVDLRVAGDLSKAEFDYVPLNDQSRVLTSDVDDIVQALIMRAAEGIERKALESGGAPGLQLRTQA